MRSTLVTLLGAALAAGAAQAEPSLNWTPLPRQWPIARLEAPTVYDSVNQRVLVFGGYDHNYNRNNEVWEYTPATQTWRNVTPTGPAPVPRSGSAMAYDPVRGRAVLFGGLNDSRSFLGDTWVWNCSARTWTQVASGGTAGINKPEARQGLQMVYDPANDRVLLFGGINQDQFFRDTWVFSPGAQTWSKLTTGTSSSNARSLRGRGFHGLTVSSDNRVFLFAGEGYNADFPYPGGAGSVLLFEDLWELVGTTWTDRTPSGVAAGNHGACATASACPGKAGWRAFAYDANGHRLVTQGGYWFSPDYSTAGNLKEVWTYSLATGLWSQQSANIAGGDSWSLRDSHAFVYAASVSKLILTGGYLADLWELSGTTWTSPAAFDPRTSFNVYTYPRQDYQAMAWDSARNRLLAVSAGAHETWRLDPSTWNWSIAAVGYFTERAGYGLAYHAGLDRLFLFGGRCKSLGAYQTLPDGVGSTCGASGTVYNDLWSFNPATGGWTQVSPSGGPPAARWDHALVYDSVNNELVAFGGRNLAGTALSDTWVLTCSGATTCAWAAGGSGPSARYGHAMAHDPATSRVVLYGGQRAGVLGDVWAWNGASNSWAAVTPAGTAPPARVHAALARADQSVPGLVMFGGRDGSAARNDAWLLSGVGGATPRWQALAVGGSAPLARENAEMLYTPTLNRILMYGGFDNVSLPAGERGLLPGDPYVATFSAAGPVHNDFDVDGRTDLAVFYPAGGLWFLRSSFTGATTGFGFGGSGYVPVPADYDGDHRADVAMYHPPTGLWFFRNYQTGAVTSLGWGGSAYEAVPGDYDGDGLTDVAAFHSTLGLWFIRQSSLGGAQATYDFGGGGGYTTVPRDYDGDGKTDLAVYNASTGLWYVRNSSTGTTTSTGFGGTSYEPVPGDYDGDGKADIAVYHTTLGIWFVKNSSTGTTTSTDFGGGPGFTPVPGHFDADAKLDLALYSESTGLWFWKLSTTGATYSQGYGGSGYKPVPF